MTEPQSAAQRAAALINKGKFEQVIELATTNKVQRMCSDDCQDALFWSQVAAAERKLHPGSPKIALHEQRAKLCDNYTTQLEGDLHRTAAIEAIELGKFAAAVDELHQAAACHAGDQNRLCILDVVAGWLFASQGDHKQALHRYARAEHQWRFLEDVEAGPSLHDWHSIDDIIADAVDRTWVTTMAYWRLLSLIRLAATGERYDLPMQRDYAFVMMSSQDPQQLVSAWLGYRGGVRGLWIANHNQWLSTRLAPFIRRLAAIPN